MKKRKYSFIDMMLFEMGSGVAIREKFNYKIGRDQCDYYTLKPKNEQRKTKVDSK